MTTSSQILVLAVLFTVALALAVLIRRQRSIARWCFSAGMLVFAVESICGAASFRALSAAEVKVWQSIALFAKAFGPGIWLTFSLSYSRGSYREFLRNSRALILAAFLLPLGAAWVLFQQGALLVLPLEDPVEGFWVRFETGARILNALILVGNILILANLERTFRAAVGTTQWRIKFVILGLAVVFGTSIYTRVQTMLYSGYEIGFINIEGGALLVGCVLMAVGYLRTGFGEIDVYPSRAVLHTSFTVLLAAGYLFVVGVLAQLVASRGESGSFRVQALFILAAVALLAILLLSDRLRQKTQQLISRHFRRPEHDFRQVWTLFTRSISSAVDEAGICAASARSISTTFNALSVSIWLLDDHHEELFLGASTSETPPTDGLTTTFARPQLAAGAPSHARPVDLEKSREDWAAVLRSVTANQFPNGGNRLCIPLVARDRWLGAVVLADRVSGIRYTSEELDLLECVGDQVATALLNARLAEEILRGKELEAFRTMSAFFVHDLKNVASTLTLTLQNLPLHFDNPDFRADAVRGIGKTVTRMNELISRLGTLRQKLEIRPAPLDLNELVEEVLKGTALPPQLRVQRKGESLPCIVGDRDQLQSVLVNLMLNAADAVNLEADAVVTIETSQRPGWATIAVTDNGCGMSAEFLRDSLFRPFHSTKKNGLGIGMFQSKMIVVAHGGHVQVKSEVGSGTTFRVMLPISSKAE